MDKTLCTSNGSNCSQKSYLTAHTGPKCTNTSSWMAVLASRDATNAAIHA